MGDSKEILRARIARLRDSLSGFDAGRLGRSIAARALLLEPYLEARSVALYSPVGNEVATGAIREHAQKTGKKLFYPRSGAGGEFQLVRLADGEELAPGRYGILEPAGDGVLGAGDAAVDDDRGDDGLVVFVPGIAFDLRGNRLGRGKGWYDRLLAALGARATAIALAYEFQMSEEIPTEAWDRKVDHIVTERRIIDCRSLPSGSGVSGNSGKFGKFGWTS